MSRRIYFDGLNLSLERGTGIATYTRLLAGIARDLGYDIGVVYSSRNRPSKNPILREISFFDYRDEDRRPKAGDVWDAIVDQFHHPFGIKPGALNLSGFVVTDQFRGRMPSTENLFVARNLFANGSCAGRETT